MYRPIDYVKAVAMAAGLLFLLAALEPRDTARTPDGEEVYIRHCMDCHQDGTGTPDTVPPLDGSPWVHGDSGRLIRIVLHGLVGEIKVDGRRYNGVMPAWRNLLDDEEIAAVLTYIRAAWSNDAGPIPADSVAATRAATAGRQQPWTVEELGE